MALTVFDSTQLNTVTSSKVIGTTTNDNAAAGYLGQVISSFAQGVAAPTSGQIGDVTSIALTAGDWMMCGEIYASVGAASTITELNIAITTTSGNSATGWIAGDNNFYSAIPTGANSYQTIPLVARRFSISSSTTYYLKIGLSYTGTAACNGRITAWRIR